MRGLVWYHSGMCQTTTNKEPRRTYCSRCEEAVIGFTDNMCQDCCDAIVAERRRQQAEEDWKEWVAEGRFNCCLRW